MELTILGSGSYMTDLSHFGPSYFFVHKDKKILVDAGPGSVIQLLKLGIKPYEIDYIFLTHFHADHTGDLISYLISLKLAKRSGKVDQDKKIVIVGQEGTSEFIEGLYKLYDHELGNDYTALTLRSKTKILDFTVEPYKVRHTNIKAKALRFEIDRKITVFSGDTSYCEGIINAAKDADLLIVDAANPRGMVNDFHLNVDEIADICTKASVKRVVLTHLTERVFKEDQVGEVQANFSGEIEKAEDLKKIII